MDLIINIINWFCIYFITKRMCKKCKYGFLKDWNSDKDCSFLTMSLMSYLHAFILCVETILSLSNKDCFVLTDKFNENDTNIVIFFIILFFL